ncbi:hypothetical protein ACQ4PT_017752 [Festuca glaucescens]
MLPKWMVDAPPHLARDWHAHYQSGITALTLVVLELQENGKLIASDEPLIVFVKPVSGNLLRFSLRDKSVKLVDGKMEIGELQFAGKLNHTRTLADSHSKVLFQYAARHASLRIKDLVASVQSNSMEVESTDAEMQD